MGDRLINLLAPWYKCTCCVREGIKDSNGNAIQERTFSCFRQDVLWLFPSSVKVQFPFYVTHQNAVDLGSIMDGLAECITSSQSVGNFARRLNNRHETALKKKEIQYYTKASELWESALQKEVDTKGNLNSFVLRSDYAVPEQMKSERDTVYVLSENYLLTTWHKFFGEDKRIPTHDPSVKITWENYFQRRMQLVGGRVWKADGSHKVSKLFKCSFKYTER